MISKLIVPLDGSHEAERALPYARFLAAEYDAEVSLVSVVEAPAEFATWAGAPNLARPREIEQWFEIRENYLHDIQGTFNTAQSSINVDLGSPASAVLEEVIEPDTSLIVMASHGRTGFRRLVLGSVTSRIVRQALCPVLIVPAHDDQAGVDPGIDRIVVPLDGSDNAWRALDAAINLLNLSGRQLHLVRVIQGPDVTAPTSDAAPRSAVDYGVVVEYREAAREEADRYLDSAAAELSARGIHTSWEVRDGNVVDEIRAAAAGLNAQMIAMSTHGRSGLDRLMLGSVTEKLASEIHRPLLIFGPGNED